MPLELGVWRIDAQLTRVVPTRLDQESRLEDLIDHDISLVRDDLWIIGRQVPTSYGHFVDLLAIDAAGNLTVLELKRDKTPREVVAQALDYGSWVRRLGRDDLARIYGEYARKHNKGQPPTAFDAAFATRFGGRLPDTVNESHELVVVASELDDSTERIIAYLVDEYSVPVNAVFFRVFKDGEREYLTRAWLRDPTETQEQTEEAQARQKGKEPWNGVDYYVSFGHGDHRDWEDARQYGFVSAGGDEWYTRTLRKLQPGSRVFACVPDHGYVGVGKVTEAARPATQFEVASPRGNVPLSTLPLRAKSMFNGDGRELLVRVEWIKTLPLAEAIWEKGLFANQNSACKLRNKFTIERLRERLDLRD